MMVMTMANKKMKPRTCNICNKTTLYWNKQHFKGGCKRVCVECHNDLNYYLARVEEANFTWNDIEQVKQLIQERKEKYGARDWGIEYLIKAREKQNSMIRPVEKW